MKQIIDETFVENYEKEIQPGDENRFKKCGVLTNYYVVAVTWSIVFYCSKGKV